ncbi:hypothetical protein EDC96DRAFT_313904 [Choanephora cucurbitarum]|nr:hypothetical protein EDC96DRAFT_313904 [Choanephora cucurbitarum]
MTKGCPTRYKKCFWAVVCENSDYILYDKEYRPYHSLNLIKAQNCMHCKQTLTHTLIHDEREDVTSCTFKCSGGHTHGVIPRLHLSGDQSNMVLETVKNDQTKTPENFSIGLISRPGEFVLPAKKISFVMGNQDRAKYELNVAKTFLGISKNSDFLGDLGKIMSDFESYIVHAQVSNDKNFMVAFSAPSISGFKLPFSHQPIVTDLTYKAESADKKYLCSYVIYVPEMKEFSDKEGKCLDVVDCFLCELSDKS